MVFLNRFPLIVFYFMPELMKKFNFSIVLAQLSLEIWTRKYYVGV